MGLLLLLLFAVLSSSVITADEHERPIGFVLLAKNPANLTYCVAREGADQKILQEGLDWVCSQPNFTCSNLLPGHLCYEPNTVEAHASYAFNMYYYENVGRPETCGFKGAAWISTTNPSHGLCIFVGSRNGASPNGSVIFPPPGSSIGSTLHASCFIVSVLLLLVVSLVV